MTNKLNKGTNIDKSDEVKASEVFNIDTDLIVSKFIRNLANNINNESIFLP